MLENFWEGWKGRVEKETLPDRFSGCAGDYLAHLIQVDVHHEVLFGVIG